MQALLVTGATYPNRRAIRALGGVWQKDLTGYAAPAERREALQAIAGLSVRDWDYDVDPFKPLSPDELRAYRQDRQDRRAERLRERAELADKRADKVAKRISKGELEFLGLCEPVKIGHHSQRRHEKLIKRAQDAFFKEGEERNYAQTLRSRADWVMPAAVKGDAERARQERRDAAEALIGLGDIVHSALYGQGVVTKVNKKSFTVNITERGFVITVDKSHARLIAKGTGPVKITHKFKAGDKVTAKRLLATYEGTVTRRTSRGYSIEYVSHGRTWVRTFSESDLTLRE